MTDKTWKQIERRVAEFFGTIRTPLSSSHSRHTQSDTLHKELFIEIKYRKKIPFLTTFKDTIKKAKEETKTPLVVFVEKGSQTPILMCNLKDIRKIAQKIK
ncbi:MAG: hypothetical protein KAJ49_03335 [Arcobacteraceae bacterium]|nr:hypothetical protein [Arcobacteraceae bacterium]